MTLLILKLLISIAILYGLYLLYQGKDPTKQRWQFTDRGSKQQPSKHLQIKLLQLLNGDRNTANRLIASAKARNPDRTIDWCVEKVIFDLQRDRGRY
ncbi:hypothetical protein [Synechocystis sp. PCC 7509]|uniref:hypothetical protein n=1 Tax=Synechocystis sp. PCC 7509 TaxID=927677 RepID=UPI0002ABE2B5|nr:hypothetical protein [Synechocystis sp. PCC 7509]